MAKKVLIVLADGFEEIEAVTPIDVLRRAGLEVTVAGVGKTLIESTRGLKIQTDILLEKYEGLPDAVVLPGGMPGAKNLSGSGALGSLLDRMSREGKVIGAICAAPAVVLAKRGILDGRKATGYPGFEKEFGPKTTLSEARVVKDGNVITSRGPGTALEFSLELAALLAGPEASRKIAEAMLAKP